MLYDCSYVNIRSMSQCPKSKMDASPTPATPEPVDGLLWELRYSRTSTTGGGLSRCAARGGPPGGGFVVAARFGDEMEGASVDGEGGGRRFAVVAAQGDGVEEAPAREWRVTLPMAAR